MILQHLYYMCADNLNLELSAQSVFVLAYNKISYDTCVVSDECDDTLWPILAKL